MAKIRVYKTLFIFECPGCGDTHHFNNGWSFDGNVNEPTVTPSILVNGNPAYLNPSLPRCHSFITKGKIKFLDDCTHYLKGQTVDLPEITGD